MHLAGEESRAMEKTRRFSIIGLVIACITALLSLHLVEFAWGMVDAWAKFWLRPAGAFYVEFWMSKSVVFWALAAPGVLLLTGVGALASLRSSWPRWPVIALPIALATALFSLMVFPSTPLRDMEQTRNADHLADVGHLIAIWSGNGDRFPLTQSELEHALRPWLEGPSIYRQKRQIINYQIEFHANQNGPYRANPERPGIVYYAVNQSGSKFWLTISGLNAPFANRPQMMRVDPYTAETQPWGDLLVEDDISALVHEN
jgi:hypothetical protein